MEAKAITKYLRISPRKLRLVLDAVRNKSVQQAFGILQTLKKKGSKMVLKTLKSAEAAAKQKKMDENRLYVREIFANGGPTMKRFMSRSMGRADVILKRMSHLTVVVGERAAKQVKETPAEEKSDSKKKFWNMDRLGKGKKAVGAGK